MQNKNQNSLIERTTGNTKPEVYTLDDNYKVEVNAWRYVLLQARYKGHPKPSLKWFVNDTDEIDSYYHHVSIINGLVTLEINERAFMHMTTVTYTLNAENSHGSTVKNFQLFVKGCRQCCSPTHSSVVLITLFCRTTENNRPKH